MLWYYHNMMLPIISWRRITLIIIIMSLIALRLPAYAACTIDEIVSYVDEGLSNMEIISQCRSVEDSNCSISKIAKLARDKSPLSQIKGTCKTASSSRDNDVYRPPSSQRATLCFTTVGSCQLVMSVFVGGACYCATPYGNFPGIAR